MTPEQAQRRPQTICEILRNQVGHDFTGYKERTFLRRVQRRMQVLQLGTHRGLHRAAAAGAGRGVAAVPRPADRRHQLLPRRGGLRGARRSSSCRACSRGAGADDTVRVWVPGLLPPARRSTRSPSCCASSWTRSARCRKVQIFATDIDERGARRGAGRPLPRGAPPRHVPPERLRALLHRGRRKLPSRQGGARPVRLLLAQRHPRPALLAHRPDLLPQPADLPRRRAAERR